MSALYVLDTSDRRPSYVLDCDSGVQMRLSALAYRVLSARREGASFEEIAAAYGDGDRILTTREVTRVYDHVMARVDAVERRRAAHRPAFGPSLRCALLPAALVARLSVPFALLFQPFVALIAMLLSGGAAAYAFSARPVSWPTQTTRDLIVGFALFLLSCLAHELGHAGACRRFGVRPGAIGIALYLVFPALYSDVTRIWRLKRSQRVAVDAAGIYVQSLCAGVYALLFAQTHAAALLVALSLIVGALLLDLNPLFRFDGYWIVADALGITELSAQVGVTLRRLVERLAGSERTTATPWSSATTALLSLYSVAAVGCWMWFAGILLARAAADGPWAVAAAWALAKHEQPLTFALAGRSAAALAGGFALAYCVITLLRFVREATIEPAGAAVRVTR